MAESQLKAVLFDVDGTLYPQSFFIKTSLQFFLRHPRLSLAFRHLRHDVRQFGGVEDLHLAQISLCAGYMRIPAERAEELLETHIYGTYMDMLSMAKPYPQVEPLLADLKEAGLKLGVITDYPTGDKLSALGFDKYWDVAISADTMGHLKPEADAFLLAAEELKISPEQIIYVGNEYKYDIIGAKKAGMKAAHLAAKPVPDSVADITFSDFDDLRSYIFGN
ncbi:MAG: HAD family hydrolase [Spirochaetia bacterium]|nr:HAD family hydrolase [Spirochaetia bacterium]